MIILQKLLRLTGAQWFGDTDRHLDEINRRLAVLEAWLSSMDTALWRLDQGARYPDPTLEEVTGAGAFDQPANAATLAPPITAKTVATLAEDIRAEVQNLKRKFPTDVEELLKP